ncbi:MAG: hypothetical protein ACR2P2_15465 [Nakamurella sp.]
MLTVAEAARQVGVSHWTIRRRIKDGSLTELHEQRRGLLRVDPAELSALIHEVPTVGWCKITSIDPTPELVSGSQAGTVEPGETVRGGNDA